jgi:lambda family phage portal protein
MGVFDWLFGGSSATSESTREGGSAHGKNPHINQRSGFYSNNVDRLLSGWTTQSASVDSYLKHQLHSLRARSRDLVRTNPYGKKAVMVLRKNVVGADGIGVHTATTLGSGNKVKLDKVANDAIDAAWKDWCENECDFEEQMSFLDFQDLCITTAPQDGEFIVRIHEGRESGKYGMQLSFIDSELLDVAKNEQRTDGSSIRLGVERDSNGKITRYHFKHLGIEGNYNSGDGYTVEARYIIHCFVRDYANQSRGIPWFHASLEEVKALDSYDEAAITAARWGASKMAVLSSDDSIDDSYSGETDAMGNSLESVEAGAIWDIGGRKLESFDPKYPHEMYAAFKKSNLRAVSTGWDISYATIANDLEDVNYSSIRAGVLDERDGYKKLQNWFIRSFIKKVRNRWIANAILNNSIKINGKNLFKSADEYLPARYQPRRWQWVDPAKDSKAAVEAINNKLKSRSQIIRESGDNPDDVFAEIAAENEKLAALGISVIIDKSGKAVADTEDVGEDESDSKTTSKKGANKNA